MAPQSVPEAFSKDFLFPLQRIKFPLLGFLFFPSFGGAPVKCRWLETSFSRVRSAAGEGSALRLGETDKERTQTPQAFQTIVIP